MDVFKLWVCNMSFCYFDNGNHIIGHLYPVSTPVGIVGIAPLDSGMEGLSLESHLRRLQKESHNTVPEILVQMLGEMDKGALELWLGRFPNERNPEMLRLVYMLDGKILDETTSKVIYVAVAAHLPDAKGKMVDYSGIFVDGEQIAGISLKNGTPHTSNGKILRRLGSYLESEYGDTLSSIPITVKVQGYDEKGEVVSTRIEKELLVTPKIQGIEAHLVKTS